MPAEESYAERLWVPVSWWLGGLGAVGVVWWIFVLVTPGWLALAAGVSTAGLVGWALASYGGAAIEVDDFGLRAGRARLPWTHVGPSIALDQEETRRQLGPDADARAYLLVRAYCSGSVKVYVDDEADPTPYWIMSTRRATTLAAHLNQRLN